MDRSGQRPCSVSAKRCANYPCSNDVSNASIPSTETSSCNSPNSFRSCHSLMRAPSRALVLVPSLPVCPAVFLSHVLLLNAQHTLTVCPFEPMFKHSSLTLTVRPFEPMFKLKGLTLAHTEDWCSTTTPAAAADVAVAPPTSDLGCNSSMMCCLSGSLTQPQPASTTAYSASAFAAFSNLLRHAQVSAYTGLLPELRTLSWPHTLLLGNFMFLLGILVPGMFFPLRSAAFHLFQCYRNYYQPKARFVATNDAVSAYIMHNS